MANLQDNLHKYAKLAVEVGLNVQDGQKVVVRAPIAAADFTRIAVEKAYESGASDVTVFWSDEDVTLSRMKHASEESLDQFPQWQADGMEKLAEEGAAFLSVVANNPDLLKEIPAGRVAKANKAAAVAMQPFREYASSNKVAWNIVAVPSEAWAKKVFPDKNTDEAIEALWEQIFSATRVDTPNPVQSWKDHVSALSRYREFLNENEFKTIYLKSAITDLTLELPEKHLWCGASSNNEKGTEFVANIPTEEIFTMPTKTGVNGVVKSTKPLNYGGNVIDNFELKFKDGKVVEFSAEQGEDTLKELLGTDEGAKYLGELALVPNDSPISNSNVIFFNTLFDENASCHLAFGNAYPTNLKGGEDMSKEELEKEGANTSLTHVDFMIGSADMNIIGEKANGEKVDIFKDGDWAF